MKTSHCNQPIACDKVTKKEQPALLSSCYETIMLENMGKWIIFITVWETIWSFLQSNLPSCFFPNLLWKEENTIWFLPFLCFSLLNRWINWICLCTEQKKKPDSQQKACLATIISYQWFSLSEPAHRNKVVQTELFLLMPQTHTYDLYCDQDKEPLFFFKKKKASSMRYTSIVLMFAWCYHLSWF